MPVELEACDVDATVVEALLTVVAVVL